MAGWRWIVLGITLAVAPVSASDSLPEVEVTAVSDLARDGALIRRHGVPMMLEFSATDCSYCELLEEELLKPMLRNDAYRAQVIIRKIDIDATGYIRDFDGTRVPTGDFAGRYDIEYTPTLVFLDAEGADLGHRIVGIQSVDFIGGEVDDAIMQSRKALHSASVETR